MSIIVGYVPTPVGKAALAAAIAEAKLRNEELLIVNSSREGALVDKNTASMDDWNEVDAAVAAAGIESQIIESTYRDDLTEEFLRIASEQDVSLIVIGLRHRTQVGKFIMGSHAQRILLQADRPVLAVKASA
ncbi:MULTISPECIES: universal stress protein [Glutamicibacter]|uniref:Universal stress protein n=1 Tax=Glutamicibacter halophytocola TaxID=1933880 RepID=A0A5B8IWJ8_9MICC|nr:MULTISPECIES: universal stress protein [Glutamicibacter]ALG30045.1 universal stress protein UspA [Glutamicibacter halophytocola]MBF6670784.1 universal stress protein [Glutamicibacter sp. FBE19]NQD41792.1 universal stress protein [Glutamicibacter halophytocola]QDY66320.1 universal stress protein [Glutamicibacter halophytocola]UUX58419.1 universal stress protein [Glutamicibacter halophytocola]